eukprot:2324775-Pyramimonas_sp.AAC.1
MHVGTVQDIVPVFACIAAQPPCRYPAALQFLGDFFGKNSQFEIADSQELGLSLLGRWQLSTVETAYGASSFPGDVVSSQRAFWGAIWDGLDEAPQRDGQGLIQDTGGDLLRDLGGMIRKGP